MMAGMWEMVTEREYRWRRYVLRRVVDRWGVYRRCGGLAVPAVYETAAEAVEALRGWRYAPRGVPDV